MRIGIITPWWTHDNYGQILQGYALQKVLNAEGYDAFIIKYNAQSDNAIYKAREDGFIHYVMSYVRQFVRYLVYDLMSIYDIRKFNDFKKKNIKFSRLYLTYEKLLKIYPEADVYIAGSDQIWGPWFRLEPYFLNFGKKETKKITYASSFGREKLSDKEKTTITPLIKKLDYIGVRELSGVNIIKELGDNRSEWVPDPTLLLSKKDWESTIGKRQKYKKNKIFVYIIGSDKNKEIKKTIDIINQDGKYTILCTSDSNDPLQNITPTIGEWINIISDSDMIITNSFHGTIFSLIFNKEFITLSRTGENTKKMNTRIKPLLEKIGLKERYVEYVDEVIIRQIKNNPVDWGKVNKYIDLWRKDGISFLRKSILNS